MTTRIDTYKMLNRKRAQWLSDQLSQTRQPLLEVGFVFHHGQGAQFGSGRALHECENKSVNCIGFETNTAALMLIPKCMPESVLEFRQMLPSRLQQAQGLCVSLP